jgi:hypothetical protein
MVKKHLYILLVLSFQITANGQDVSYSDMDMSTLAKNAKMKDESMRVRYIRNLQFLFDSFAGYHLDERSAKKEKEQEALRISTLQKIFSLREKYPDSIASGWHNVLLTDNKDFCKDAKVLVARNTVLQLVVDDCIRIRCTSKGQIKNARSEVTFNDINSGYEVLNVYCINDLDSAALIDEPMQPGFVCFWTSKDKYLNERLMINGIIRDFISKTHEEEPDCIDKGVLFYIMKPGTYRFRATKTGNDKEARFEIKSGMCLKYQLK